mgnify:CR=1 FL=1
MSKVWRLHTKPKVSVKNKLETKVANELIKRKIVAIGWTLREDIYNELTATGKNELEEDEKSIKDDFEKYKKIIEKNNYETIKGEKKSFFYGKVIRLNNLKKDDLIWIRSKGKYHLGRVTEKSHYLYAYRDSQKNSDILKLGINNQFTDIDWCEVGSESDIPGRILIAFYQKGTLIEIDEESALNISQIIYNKKDKYYEIDNKILNNKENFYGLLSPYDCEDLLYFYLYNKNKYVVIPSTNKTSTQNYEFEMINHENRNEKIYIQVKNGYSKGSDLYLEDYQKLDGKVYLLTTAGNIYETKTKKKLLQIAFKQNYEFEEIGSTKNKNKIYAINPEALYEFAKRAYKDETILMPHSILQWFEYLK